MLTATNAGFAFFVGAITLGWIASKAFKGYLKDRAELYYQKTEQNNTIISKCVCLISDYCYPIWGASNHLQTAYSSLVRRAPLPEYKREFFYLADGGLIILDWLLQDEDNELELFGKQLQSVDISQTPADSLEKSINDEQNEEQIQHQQDVDSLTPHSHVIKQSSSTIPTIVVCPGICNNSGAHYIRSFASSAKENGYRVVVFTPRGCAELATTAKLFTYGDTSDIRSTIAHIAELFPNSQLIGSSYSMGANMLSKYVGEEGRAHKRDPENHKMLLSVATAVSVGYDGYEAIEHIKLNYPNSYYKTLSRKLTTLLERHEDRFKSDVDVKNLLKTVKTVEDYDREFTCKAHNINFETYYKEHSCIHYLRDITIPFLFLNALDDPLIPTHVIPYDLPQDNPNIILATTKYGGHLGWARYIEEQPLSLLVPHATHWHDLVVLEFAAAATHYIESNHNNNDNTNNDHDNNKKNNE